MQSTYSFTERLIQKLKVQRVSECPKCLGIGFFFEGGHRVQGNFQVCSCISHLCQESKCYLPYERYFPEKKHIAACECREARLAVSRIQSLFLKSQIPYKYSGYFLDDIELGQQHKESNLAIALDHAEEIVSEYQNKTISGIYLYGGTGCGKTLLSCSILNELLRFHKLDVRYAKISRDILGKIRASYNPNSTSYGEGAKIEKQLSRVSALVIDDFEIYKETDWAQSLLYDIIDSRYEYELLTIINSNQRMSYWSDMAKGRIYSRLREMCREISIIAPDYRTEIYAQSTYN